MAQAKHASAVEIEGPRSLRRSRDEGKALVEQWRESGLGPAEFCRARGIAEQRLHYWKRRLQREGVREETEAEAFVWVRAAGEDEPTIGTGAAGPESSAEICLPGSLRVRVSLAAGPTAFVHALRGVLQVLEP
jgi:hypothetical protein